MLEIVAHRPSGPLFLQRAMRFCSQHSSTISGLVSVLAGYLLYRRWRAMEQSRRRKKEKTRNDVYEENFSSYEEINDHDECTPIKMTEQDGNLTFEDDVRRHTPEQFVVQDEDVHEVMMSMKKGEENNNCSSDEFRKVASPQRTRNSLYTNELFLPANEFLFKSPLKVVSPDDHFQDESCRGGSSPLRNECPRSAAKDANISGTSVEASSCSRIISKCDEKDDQQLVAQSSAVLPAAADVNKAESVSPVKQVTESAASARPRKKSRAKSNKSRTKGKKSRRRR